MIGLDFPRLFVLFQCNGSSLIYTEGTLPQHATTWAQINTVYHLNKATGVHQHSPEGSLIGDPFQQYRNVGHGPYTYSSCSRRHLDEGRYVLDRWFSILEAQISPMRCSTHFSTTHFPQRVRVGSRFLQDLLKIMNRQNLQCRYYFGHMTSCPSPDY